MTPPPLSHRLLGHDIQILEVRLPPQQTLLAEAGAMLYLDAHLTMESRLATRASEGLARSLLNVGKRLLGGESAFLTHIHNPSQQPAFAAFAAPYPGSILALDMAKHSQQGIIAQRGAFLCSSDTVTLHPSLTKKLMAGFFGGEGFILQHLQGTGMAFLHAGGSLISRTLEAGQSLLVDAGCLVAMDATVEYQVQPVKGIKSMLFAGEGLFLLHLTGPGTVWLQSAPYSRTLAHIRQDVLGHLKHQKNPRR